MSGGQASNNSEAGTAASLLRFADSALKIVAAVNLFAMMGVTTVDVMGRYFLNSPLPGAFEITEVMMAILVFSVLPLVTARNEHITIGLFDRHFKGRAAHVKTLLVSLVCALFVGGATWRVWIEAGRMAAIEDRTAYLGIWLWPLAYYMFCMLAITLASLLVLVVFGLLATLATKGR